MDLNCFRSYGLGVLACEGKRTFMTLFFFFFFNSVLSDKKDTLQHTPVKKPKVESVSYKVCLLYLSHASTRCMSLTVCVTTAAKPSYRHFSHPLLPSALPVCPEQVAFIAGMKHNLVQWLEQLLCDQA